MEKSCTLNFSIFINDLKSLVYFYFYCFKKGPLTLFELNKTTGELGPDPNRPRVKTRPWTCWWHLGCHNK